MIRPRRDDRPTAGLSAVERLKAMTGRGHTSWSQLNTYRACSLRWFFERVERAKPEEISANFILGTCVHESIEALLAAQLAVDRPLSLDDLIAVYDEKWSDEAQGQVIRYSKGQNAEILRDTARRMFDAFMQTEHAKVGSRTIAIEHAFEVPMGPGMPALGGRIDLLTHDDGVVTLTDFKTSRGVWNAKQLRSQATQLLLYAEGIKPIAEELGAELKLQFVVITKAAKPSVQCFDVPLDPEQVASTRKVFARVIEAMLSGIVLPSPSPMNCSVCPFTRRCSRWHKEV